MSWTPRRTRSSRGSYPRARPHPPGLARPGRPRSGRKNGRMTAMKIVEQTTIDKAGRVLIPKKVRDLAALAPGAAVEARYEDGCIILMAAPSPVRIEKRGRFFIAMPEAGTPPLTHDTVEATRRRVRRDRGADD